MASHVGSTQLIVLCCVVVVVVVVSGASDVELHLNQYGYKPGEPDVQKTTSPGAGREPLSPHDLTANSPSNSRPPHTVLRQASAMSVLASTSSSSSAAAASTAARSSISGSASVASTTASANARPSLTGSGFSAKKVDTK
jgi:hypothetical protein